MKAWVNFCSARSSQSELMKLGTRHVTLIKLVLLCIMVRHVWFEQINLAVNDVGVLSVTSESEVVSLKVKHAILFDADFMNACRIVLFKYGV